MIVLLGGLCLRAWDVAVARRLSPFIIPDGPSVFSCQGELRNNLQGKAYTYIQPSLEELAAPEQAEQQFENCVVLTRPTYKDTGKKQEWSVAVHAQPSIFQPDTDMELLASVRSELATLSQRKSLMGIGWRSRELSPHRPSPFPTGKPKPSPALL